jgi:hypothetical protein
MCDYSLMSVPNRLAVCGEELVVHRFEMGSIGFASAADVERAQQPVAADSSQSSLLGRLKRWLYPPAPGQCPAVCVPPGARLLLRDIPEKLQKCLGFESVLQEVTFTQIGVSGYRDAIRFANGRELLLQRLSVGQRVRVLALSAEHENNELGAGAQRLVPSDVGL